MGAPVTDLRNFSFGSCAVGCLLAQINLTLIANWSGAVMCPACRRGTPGWRLRLAINLQKTSKIDSLRPPSAF